MHWTMIAATVLVTAATLANPLTAAEIVTHLPTDLRSSLQRGREVFQIRADVSAIPEAVRSAFAKAAGEESFAMAEPGAAWQATDVILQPALPWRRLGKVALSRSFCLIFYEHGGRARTHHVTAFHVSSTGATLVWHAVYLRDFITEPAALIKAVDEGDIDYDPNIRF